MSCSVMATQQDLALLLRVRVLPRQPQDNIIGCEMRQRGLSLVEIIVSMAIVTIGLLAISGMLKYCLHTAQRSFELTDHIYQAQTGFTITNPDNITYIELEHIVGTKNVYAYKVSTYAPRLSG